MNLIERAAARITEEAPRSLLERAEAQGLFATVPPTAHVVAPAVIPAVIPAATPAAERTGAAWPDALPKPPSRDVTAGIATVALDRAALAAAGYVLPEGRRDRLAEELRIIRQRLAPPGAVPLSSVMITSSWAGEGKTFFALNLALAAARDEDRPILLVDGDLRRQGLSRILGLGESPGIHAFLEGSEPFEACLRRVEGLSLTILPAGRNAASEEPMTEPQIRQLVEMAAARMPDCLVIYDAPPLLAATEAILLAPQVDQVLFVVEADRTPERAISAALDLLSSTEHVSMVLNKAPARRGDDTFGAYYAPQDDAGQTVRS
ncbi:P-loop NTPase family protein [Arenibaculum pallidiluteum]|uniref:hypothetical protein n=1 Tax=Arenibaculum pallidiluteum TaxID=2812559 RepID=UPI001A979B74|nr:hypothetical protein [Arenibaculum pallidiluteum]